MKKGGAGDLKGGRKQNEGDTENKPWFLGLFGKVWGRKQCTDGGNVWDSRGGVQMGQTRALSRVK